MLSWGWEKFNKLQCERSKWIPSVAAINTAEDVRRSEWLDGFIHLSIILSYYKTETITLQHKHLFKSNPGGILRGTRQEIRRAERQEEEGTRMARWSNWGKKRRKRGQTERELSVQMVEQLLSNCEKQRDVLNKTTLSSRRPYRSLAVPPLSVPSRVL